jgi:hypothetical protein
VLIEYLARVTGALQAQKASGISDSQIAIFRTAKFGSDPPAAIKRSRHETRRFDQPLPLGPLMSLSLLCGPASAPGNSDAVVPRIQAEFW